jgi:predicted HD phosphohydrolase
MTTRAGKPEWTSLDTAGRADILAVEAVDQKWAAQLASRVLTHLQALRGLRDAAVMPIDRLEHSLQCATRAYRDNRSDDYVVCALLHDLGDLLMPYNHGALAASIVKPFVSERLHWIVQQHGMFQGYYYFHHLGLDRHARDRYLDHPWYADAVEFCERFDQCSFDPGYTSLPLDFFEPAVHRVMAMPHGRAPYGEAALRSRPEY